MRKGVRQFVSQAVMLLDSEFCLLSTDSPLASMNGWET